MDYDHDSLLVQLETLQKTLKQREEDCENSSKRIAELEIAIQEVNSDPSNCQELQVEQVRILQNNFNMIWNLHNQLQEKFFNMMAKKNYYKKNYKSLQESQKDIPPRTNSEAESDNEQLRKEIVELKRDVEYYKEKSKTEKEQADTIQAQYESNLKQLDELKKTAQEHYDLIKQKMHDAREGKADPDEIAQLKKEVTEQKEENGLLQTTIEALNETAQQMASSQADFINSLSTQLGCQPELDEIVDQVKKLTPLKVENLKLNMELDKLKILGTVDQNEAYLNIVDGLKEMQSKISPDELKLDVNSPLKQLFSAIHNMINAAISPNVSKSTLQSHVRAVFYQARAFKKKDLDESSYNTFLDDDKQKHDSSINLSPKSTAIDVEIGNTFSAISTNSRINNMPSSIEFPPAKLPE